MSEIVDPEAAGSWVGRLGAFLSLACAMVCSHRWLWLPLDLG